jgi:serine/threonine-protein kinase
MQHDHFHSEEPTLRFGKATGSRPITEEIVLGGVRFRLFKELARGGMGVVYRAIDTRIDRPLAIKVLQEKHRGDADMHRRFLEEARITARLQHPGIVPIYEIGALNDGLPYFAMKLVEGQTLAQLLSQRKENDLASLLVIFEQVAQTLAFAHAQLIIHRDLKPANIMVGAFGEVQVMDWGLAKCISSTKDLPDQTAPLDVAACDQPATSSESWRDQHAASAPQILVSTEQTIIGGTPAYMAPEQFQGRDLDARTDVFGLGGLLCEILLGHPPYVTVDSLVDRLLARSNDLETTRQKLSVAPCDVAIRRLACACLAQEPSQRPANAEQVAKAMREYHLNVQNQLQQLQVKQETQQLREQTARRTRLIGTLAGGVLVVLAMVLGLLYWNWHSQRQQLAERIEVLRDEAALAQEGAQSGRAIERLQEALGIIDRAGELCRSWAATVSLRESVAKQRERIQTELDAHMRDQELIKELQAIRISRDEDSPRHSITPKFLEAFATFGIEFADTTAEVQKLRARPQAVLLEVIAALDYWCLDEIKRRGTWERPLLLAQALDDDPIRKKLREIVQLNRQEVDWTGLVEIDSIPGLISWAGPRFGGLSLIADKVQRRTALLQELSSGDLMAQPPSTLIFLVNVLAAHDRERAIHLLRQACERYPNDLWLNYELASVLENGSSSDLAEALRYFTAARALRPQVGHMMAHALERAGRGEEARKLFRELMRQQPNSGTHRACLAANLSHHGELNQARKHFAQAIELEPKSAKIRVTYADFLFRTKEFAAAQKEAQRALALVPDDGQAMTILGNIAFRQRQLDEAAKWYQRALATREEPAEAWFQLGVIFDQKQNFTQALVCYRKALAGNPTQAEANANLGYVLLRQGKLAEAEPFLRRALESKPDLVQANLHWSRFLFATKRFEEAATFQRQFRKVLPQEIAPVMDLPLALHNLGRTEEARAAHEQAIKTFPNVAALWFNYANFLMDIGSRDQAIKHFREAIRLNPEHSAAHCNLGLLYVNCGEFALALPLLERGDQLGRRSSDWRYPSQAWIAECRLMMAMEKKWPEMLNGKQTYTVAQYVQAAMMAHYKGWHARSVRLSALAQTNDRELFEREPSVWDTASQSLIQTLAGRSKEETAVSVQESDEIRRIALTWLTWDVARWTETSKQQAKTKRPAWMSATDLGRVQQENELAKMSREEADAWRTLWAKVRALSQR